MSWSTSVMTTFLMRFTEILRQKNRQAEKVASVKIIELLTQFSVSSVRCHFKSVELDDPLPITPLNDFDLTSKC